MRYLKSYKLFESTLQDKYHYHRAISKENGHLGVINNWGWKGIYLFLDVENGDIVKLGSIDEVDLISKEEFKKLYDERNYRDPKEGETFNPRQKTYGKIHDFTLKSTMGDGCSSGEYSNQFCREMASIIATYLFYKEILEKYRSIEEAREDKDNFMEIFKKYHMSPECTYSEMCDKMGLHGDSPKVGEDQIMDYIENAKRFEEENNLQGQIVKSIYKEGPSEELQFFLKVS